MNRIVLILLIVFFAVLLALAVSILPGPPLF